MAAISVLTLKEPIVPLVCTFSYDSLSTVKVENKWVTQGVEHYFKLYLPTAYDPSEKELLLYVIDQFVDAAHNDRLHLSTGASHYTKLRQVLLGDLRITWQTLSDARVAKTLDSFDQDVAAFIALYFSPSSAEDQREYLRSATKPFAMSCEALGSRLRMISSLCARLPGAGGAELFASEDLKKRALFSLMPTAWRVKFAESGQVLDGAYTYTSLVRFMSVQEALSKRSGAGKRKQAPSTPHSRSSGGRYHSRGGRSSGGRGSYGGGCGYGRGRGTYGNYQYRGGYQGYGQQNQGGSGGAPFVSPRTPTPRGSGGRFTSPVPGRSFSPQGRGRGGRFGLQPTHGRTPPRGPTPYVPNFYVGQDQFFGEPQDQFYHDGGYEEEQYYQDDSAPPEDQYYAGDGATYEDAHVAEDSGEPAAEETHWLEDFGY